jgi:hypothetical protein
LVVVTGCDDDALFGKIALLEGFGDGGGGRGGGGRRASGGGRRDHPAAFQAKRKVIPLRTSWVGDAGRQLGGRLACVPQLGDPVRVRGDLK